MDILLSIGILLCLVVLLCLFLYSSRGSTTAVPVPNERPAHVINQPAGRVAAVRPRGIRHVRQRQRRTGEEESDDEEDLSYLTAHIEGKVGTKKLRKLEEKEEKRRAREAELEEREEKKRLDELRDKKRKKEEEEREEEEKCKEEEERKIKEEKEKKEHEEYLKMKQFFSVDDEGIEETETVQESQSLLQEFISYIERSKVVLLEELAARFKLRTPDCIDRVKELMMEGKLLGLLDDRGKFICLTPDELQAVADFINKRGRVSISEISTASGNLIKLNTNVEVLQTSC